MDQNMKLMIYSIKGGVKVFNERYRLIKLNIGTSTITLHSKYVLELKSSFMIRLQISTRHSIAFEKLKLAVF